jgi:2',3'-cyclic-nucleotide 2'-phosphodiesterase (5'-nucleotidase family)
MLVDYSQSEVAVTLNGKELNDEELYTVCTTDFLAAGGDGLTGFTEAVDSESTGKLTGDIFMSFIKSQGSVAPVTEGRIKLMQTVNKIKMPKGIIKNIPTPPRD